MAILIVFPEGDVPDDARSTGWTGCCAITVLAIAWTDIALAALAYHHDVGATVRARSIVEPWTISIAAFALVLSSRLRDGLIIAYVLSMVAALIAALIPLVRCYGMPHGWKPDLADACGARRGATCRWPPPTRSNGRRAAIDLAVLGAVHARRASSAFIMSRSRSRRCRPS